MPMSMPTLLWMLLSYYLSVVYFVYSEEELHLFYLLFLSYYGMF